MVAIKLITSCRALWLIGFLSLTQMALAQWETQTRPIMGTEINVTLWHEDAKLRQQGFDAVFGEMERINQTLSPYIETSELSRVNREAAKHPVDISDELSLLIRQSIKVSELTDGAFDITYASLWRFYDYRQKQTPNAQEKAQYLKAIDYHHLKLENNQLSFTHPDVSIDLGGIAKGYAVDKSIDLLKALGFEHASVSAGGDSRLLGDKRDREWVIGIKHPRSEQDIALSIPLSDAAISTSGDYERYFIDDNGTRIHHIHQPKTGEPAQTLASVTIIGSYGLETDPLSTSVFVMGLEKGLALINRLENIEAIIITREGKVFYSDGLMPG